MTNKKNWGKLIAAFFEKVKDLQLDAEDSLRETGSPNSNMAAAYLGQVEAYDVILQLQDELLDEQTE